MKRYNAAAGATLAAVPLPDGDVAICAVTSSGGEPETETETPRYKRRKVAGRKDRPAPPSVLTLSVNSARGLVELRFPSKPDEATRAEMKAARFRWYGPAGCWYHKHTPENFAWAQQFVARHTTTSPNPQGVKPDCIALPKDDPETKLRQIWNEKGVPVEKQEAILADITAKAQPGAMVGPFQIPQSAPCAPQGVPAWRQRFHK